MKSSALPAFERQGILPGFEALRYNPTGEWLSPSPILAEGRLPSPQGRWAMYYSPHDLPGGICLAWADDLSGPWREHAGNPVISNAWPPHYRVSHVAAPHPLWMQEERRLFIWFHGENDTTRLASSTDGIEFRYEGVAIDGAMLGASSAGVACYYGRAFRHDGLPGSDRYVFLISGEPMDIYVATSPDARAWKVRPTPLILHPEGRCLCSPFLWEKDGRLFVFHHCDICDGPGDILATEVSRDLFHSFGTYPVFPASAAAPDNGRVGDPYLIESDGATYLFYTAGVRLKGRFAHAKANRGMLGALNSLGKKARTKSKAAP